MRKSTIIDLPKDIKAAIPEWKTKEDILLILEDARNGAYHCFKGNKYDLPKYALSIFLTEVQDKRLNKIIADVHEGVYDEQADQEDKEQLKADWIDSEGSAEDFYKIFGY